MNRRFRYSIGTLLIVVAAIAVTIVIANRWRAVYRGSEVGSNTKSEAQDVPLEETAIEFLQSRGFQVYAGSHSDLQATKENRGDLEGATFMRAPLAGYGRMVVVFWFDKPCRMNGKLTECGSGFDFYANAPWYMRSTCDAELDELKSSYWELESWRKYWFRYRKPFSETVQMLNEGYFRKNDPNRVWEETAYLWK